MYLRDQIMERMRMAQGDVPPEFAEREVQSALSDFGREAPAMVPGLVEAREEHARRPVDPGPPEDVR